MPYVCRQVKDLNSVVHVFGHSHINVDKVMNGTRYVQNGDICWFELCHI